MSDFFQFIPTLTKNFAVISTILTTAYSNPVLAEIPKWSTSATDLKSPSQNLASQPNPTAPSLQKKPKPDPDYIMPPRIAADEKISPFTTSLPLNNTPISHLTKWQFSSSQTFANTANSNTFLNSILKLNGRVIESLTRNNIFTVDQKGTYFQLRSVPLDRKVTTRTIEPQTLTGLEISMSLTADCVFPGTPNNQKCTYTPSIATDRNSIDPDFLAPTRVLQTSQPGEVVRPETLAFMELPGFQGGTSSQPIGLELYFPNSGAFPGNTQSQESKVEREEENNYTISTTLSRVRQVVKANDTEAVMGRTIHGFTVFFDDENRGLNTAIQAGAQFLPDVIPELKGSENAVNSNINRHLFLAANNTRLPSSSFTIYSAGVGRAKSLTPDVTSLSQVPKGSYHSIWLGLSPIIDRSINEGRTFYKPTGPQLVTSKSGGEGGQNSNIELDSAVNQDTFSTGNLQNFYAQVYLSFLQQEANFVRESIYREEISYYPHLSFTGNWTGPQDVWRYYAGVITSEKVNFYLGGDYTISTNGWSFRAGAIGYTNPDRDYYSQIFGNAAKRFRISKNANFTLSTFFNYAIDRETRIGDIVNNSPASELAASARLNWRIVSIGVTYYFGDILPNSFEDRLLLEFSIRPLQTVSFSGYIAPVDQTSSRSLYGASVTWQLNNKHNSPTLSLSWKNQEYDYGNDPFENHLIVTDNIFTVLFRLGK
ncbi:hypothetical protein [Okeania sp. SIO3B5]|uniref:hypothetical protein n=1 Tax=Okeania sp. SIO3B5 TaxID=2607811 RepID=UPI0025F5C3B6|nr:hypothetical protein [Okeania sp. SIO3B5]